MAVVRDRRPINLHLSLPCPNLSDRFGPRFPPLISPSASAIAASVSIPATELEKVQVLGHGNGGTVYKVQHKSTSKSYALKVVHGDSDLTVQRQVRREIEILRRTSSPHIVRCYETYEKPSGQVEILMEYMDAGTLDTLLRSRGTFSEREVAHISRQILKGLTYLHAQKIIHRDLKPSNLLVNKKMDVKIADFGVSKIMSRTLDECNTFVGTCAYMSPERFDSDAYGGNYNGFLADIWSFGLTIMELYVGHFPLLSPEQRPDWPTLMCTICFGDPPTLPPAASDEFRSFIQCCLRKESSERWTAAQLLDHPFLHQHPASSC